MSGGQNGGGENRPSCKALEHTVVMSLAVQNDCTAVISLAMYVESSQLLECSRPETIPQTPLTPVAGVQILSETLALECRATLGAGCTYGARHSPVAACVSTQ